MAIAIGRACALTSCRTLAEVFVRFEFVENICIVRPNGNCEFLKGNAAAHWLALNTTIGVEWRADYGLCSMQPGSAFDDHIDVNGYTAFIVHPKR